MAAHAYGFVEDRVINGTGQARIPDCRRGRPALRHGAQLPGCSCQHASTEVNAARSSLFVQLVQLLGC